MGMDRNISQIKKADIATPNNNCIILRGVVVLFFCDC
jgi:hypothetical protein